MTALAVLILCYAMIVVIAKYVRRQNFLSYLFIGFFTVIQVVFMLYYLFTMEVPTP